jgi:transposase
MRLWYNIVSITPGDIMASLIKKKKGKKLYYYLVESKRVNGKPRIVNQTYVGPAERVVRILSEYPKRVEPKEIEHLSFGLLAALLSLARRINLIDLVNRHTSKRCQGISTGDYILLIVLNRCIDPKSKRSLSTWYKKSFLPRIFGFPSSLLDSQNFWDHMDKLDKLDIEAIELDICRILIQNFGLDLEALIYDTTNFFTYIAEDNEKSKLAEHGKSKAKRSDLRQVNLALLVTRDFGIPLLHLLYEGSTHDAKLFPDVTEELVRRYKIFAKECKRITLIFDKGNNSLKNIEKIDKTEYSFVGSLKPSHHKDLLKVPLERYENLGDLKVYRTKKEVFGKTRTIVITFNPELYKKQFFHLRKVIQKEKLKLSQLKRKLNKGKWRNEEKVKEKVDKLLSKEGKKLLTVKIKEGGKLSLSVRRNQKQIYQRTKRSGKNILFTDNDSFSSEEIIKAYKGKSIIEGNFKKMKSHSTVSFIPMWHFTDQKIRVHAFCCVISLLLLNLLQREIAKNYQKMSLEEITDKLSDIKESLLFYPDTMKPIRKLSKRDDVQQRLHQILGLGEFAPKEIG